MWTIGCDIPKRPPLVPADLATPLAGSTNSKADESSGLEKSTSDQLYLDTPIGKFTKNWETWDVYFIGDLQVGYNHILAEATKDDIENSDVRYEVDNVLYVNQGKARTLQRLLQTSTETRDGQMLEFKSELHVGPVVTRHEGIVNDDQLEIGTIRGSTKSTKKIQWAADTHGLIAIEQSLRAKPMNDKGEVRGFKLLLPGQYVIATAQMRCGGTASVPMMDQSVAELNEINYEIQVDGKMPSYSTIWTNKEGEILRTFTPGINLVSYRTDQATASSMIARRHEVVALPVSGSFERPSEARRLALMISPTAAAKNAGHTLNIAPIPGQMVRDMGDGSFQVLVSQKKETPFNNFVASELLPQDSDSSPSRFIDSGDPLVRRFATAAISKRELTPTETALELTRTAHSLIEDRETPGGLMKASEVARDGTGDSTARSILLAAMLRSQKIPARLVIGLKFVPTTPQRMVYHMWTMAYVDDQWKQLDATEGGYPAADRLALTTTDLSGTKEYESFVPFLNSVSRIDLRVLRAQY